MTVALPASPRLRSALLFVLVGFVLRLQFLGNPLQHVDEQFYLLVAERMGHGVLPYVDIWDRKPLGLFLIYRLAFVLPGDPVVVMQLLGLASAAATALVVERMAQTIADARAARISGLAYLAFMPVFGCGYAQAQVFYNLPVAMAALLVVRAATRPDRGPHWRDAMLAMLLLGLAMQIKYTVVFEGVGLGLILLWRAWADRVGAVRFVAVGAVCAGLAVLPTLAVWAWYASQGHGPEFAFANFLSIAGKGASVTGEGRQIFHVILILSPLAAAVLCGPVSPKPPRVHAALRWWMLACFFGYLAFGRWHDHYVSPLLAPLAVLAAPLLAQARWYRRLMLAMCVIVSIVVAVDHGLDDPRTSEAGPPRRLPLHIPRPDRVLPPDPRLHGQPLRVPRSPGHFARSPLHRHRPCGRGAADHGGKARRGAGRQWRPPLHAQPRDPRRRRSGPAAGLHEPG